MPAAAEGDGPEETSDTPPPQHDVAGPVLLAEETTDSSQTWLLPDGSYRTEIAASPVRFREGDGDWKPIDNSLVESAAAGVAVENKAGDFQVSLPLDASERGVRVSDDGAWVSFAMEGLDGEPAVDGSSATYRAAGSEAGSASEVEYEVTAEGVKESIVLDEAPPADAEPVQFRFVVRAGSGLQVRQVDDGSMEVVDGAGEQVFVLPAPFMVDSAPAPAHSADVDYGLTRTGDSSWSLTVTPSMEWLRDPERVYPVVVDPTVTDTEMARECWINEANPTAQMCGAYPEIYKIGVNAGKARRALLRFDLDAVPVTATGVSASLKLFLDAAATLATEDAPYRTRRIGSGWSVNATWLNRTSSEPWATPGGDGAGSASAQVTLAGVGSNYKTIPATEPVAETLAISQDAGFVNLGMFVKQSAEDKENLLTFYSAAYDTNNGLGGTANARGPKLEVTWSEPSNDFKGTGDRGFYQFTSEQLTDRMAAKVNVGSGNLLLSAGDFTVAGVAGLDLALNRYYNSRTDTAADGGDGSGLGPGWSTNLGGSVRLEVPDSSTRKTVYYWGPSRYRVRYDKDINGGYTRAAPGGAGELTWDAASSTYELKGRDKQVQVFDSTGRLTTVRDKQGNELTMTYHASGNGNGKLAQVVDTRGRKAVFAYDSGGLLTQVEVRSATNTVLTRQVYGYTSTTPARLAFSEVDYVAPSLLPSPGGDPTTIGATTTYTYSAGGRLEYVNDARVESSAADGGTTRFEYTGSDGQVSAVKRLTDDGTIPDSVSTYSYVARGGSLPGSCNGEGNHSTTVDGERTDVTDTTTYCLDDHERVRRVIDAKGHVRKATWTAASNVATFDGSGLASGGTGYVTSFDSEDNPTQVTTPTGGVASAAYTDSANPHAPTAMSDFDTGGSSTSPTWNYDYDDKGNLIEAKAAVGSGTGDDVTYRYCWDGKGQLQRIDPIDAGGAMSTTLDNDVNAGCGTGSQGNDTLFTYNSLGELTGVDAPGAHRDQSMTYDALSRVKTVTDARGVTTTYTYDALGHVVAQDYAGPGNTTTSVSWTYDAAGNRLTVDDPTGPGEEFTYDELNRVVAQPQVSPSGSKEFTYDPADNLLSVKVGDEPAPTVYTYDKVNLVTSVDDQRSSSNVVSFDHDRRDRLTRTTWPMPDGNDVIRQVRYNDAGQVTCVFSHREATTALTGLASDSACPASTATGLVTFHGYDYTKTGTSVKTQNRWAVTEKGNVRTTFDYDALSRLLKATVRSGSGATIRSHEYSYDRHSSTTSMKNANYPANGATMPGLVAGTTTLAYDVNDELCWTVSGTSTNGCGSPPSGARVFTHDGVGSLTQAGVAGAAEPLGLVYNLIGQTTSIDPAGAAGAVAMSYTGVTQDRRVVKDGLRMSYGFAGMSAQGPSSGVPHTEYFVRTPGGELVSLVDSKEVGSNIRPDLAYLTDAQGSVVATIDTTGKVRRYAYEPYGRQIRTWVDPSPYAVGASGLPADGSYNAVTAADDDAGEVQPWRYASGYSDTETGMIKYGTRFYMPDVGRWTQTDPVAGKPSNPITMNPYNYAGSNPCNNTDSSGRAWCGAGTSFNILYGGFQATRGVATAAAGSLSIPFTGITLTGPAVTAYGVGGAAFGGYRAGMGLSQYRNLTSTGCGWRENYQDFVDGSWVNPVVSLLF